MHFQKGWRIEERTYSKKLKLNFKLTTVICLSRSDIKIHGQKSELSASDLNSVSETLNILTELTADLTLNKKILKT